MLKNCSGSFKGEVPSVSEDEYQTLYDSNLVSFLYFDGIYIIVVLLWLQPLVTLDFLLQCTSILEKINATLVTRKCYK